MIGLTFRRGALTVALVAWAVNSSLASPLPRCETHIELSGIRVLRVEHNGVIVLRNGRAVDVEGILLPRGESDHAPAALAHEALAAEDALADHHRVTLALQPPKEDRYGRLRAQVFFPYDHDQPWLQLMLLERGLARVDLAPDRPECAGNLYAAEAKARAGHRGIWAYRAYAIRHPNDLAKDIGTFQIVEGIIQSVGAHDGRIFLDFGPDWRSDFTATIAPKNMKRFRRAGLNPRKLMGKHVRVRGWVQSWHGPEIDLAIPQQLQILQAK
jgi:hypothetical protein